MQSETTLSTTSVSGQVEGKFDVFVSYSHLDSGWVRTWLIPRLRQAGLSVCIDRESFDVGVPSIRNMERAVAASRHTLLVCTPAWVDSSWGELEAILSYDVRTRRTLPLLYKRCALPTSIAGLSGADFTGTADPEAELSKVIDAVRGILRLGGGAPTTTLGESPRATPVGPASSLRAGQGLEALAELMREPEVQTAIAEYRTSFAAACTQIGVLGDYKDLHDLLHQLQFEFYQPVAAQLRLPPDEALYAYLGNYVGAIPDLVEQMRAVVSHGLVAEQELTWIETLAEIGELFRHAVETENSSELRAVSRDLKEILGRQPFRINMRLNEAARGLRLSALIKAVEWLRDYLMRRSIEPTRVALVDETVSILKRLDATLGPLTAAHDQWQTLEEELRKIEVMFETLTDISELQWSWSGVKKQTMALCSASMEKWSVALGESMNKLDLVLASDNPAQVRRIFPVFRSGAGRRFHQVDQDLKDLCDRLRDIGEPLGAVLRMIQ